jgi:predicted DNA-binding transcriptional regulator AlpA
MDNNTKTYKLMKAAVKDALCEFFQFGGVLGESLNTSQACKLLGVSRQTLFKYEKQGLITKTKIGGKNSYSKAEIEALKGGGV